MSLSGHNSPSGCHDSLDRSSPESGRQSRIRVRRNNSTFNSDAHPCFKKHAPSYYLRWSYSGLGPFRRGHVAVQWQLSPAADIRGAARKLTFDPNVWSGRMMKAAADGKKTDLKSHPIQPNELWEVDPANPFGSRVLHHGSFVLLGALTGRQAPRESFREARASFLG